MFRLWRFLELEKYANLGVGYTAVVAGLGVGLVLAVAVAASGTATHGDESRRSSQLSVIRDSSDASIPFRPHFSLQNGRNGLRDDGGAAWGHTHGGGWTARGGAWAPDGRPFELAVRDDKLLPLSNSAGVCATRA